MRTKSPSPKAPAERVLKDIRRATRNENPTDSPLGVDRTIYGAVRTAQREATLASREGYRIFIEVEQPDGNWKREAIIDPP